MTHWQLTLGAIHIEREEKIKHLLLKNILNTQDVKTEAI